MAIQSHTNIKNSWIYLTSTLTRMITIWFDLKWKSTIRTALLLLCVLSADRRGAHVCVWREWRIALEGNVRRRNTFRVWAGCQPGLADLPTAVRFTAGRGPCQQRTRAWAALACHPTPTGRSLHKPRFDSPAKLKPNDVLQIDLQLRLPRRHGLLYCRHVTAV